MGSPNGCLNITVRNARDMEDFLHITLSSPIERFDLNNSYSYINKKYKRCHLRQDLTKDIELISISY